MVNDTMPSNPGTAVSRAELLDWLSLLTRPVLHTICRSHNGYFESNDSARDDIITSSNAAMAASGLPRERGCVLVPYYCSSKTHVDAKWGNMLSV